jgi:hypothetical protein
MAQVIAIQATVAQMNLSKRRNIGVPFPRAVTPDRSAEIRTRPQNQFSVPAKCELFESGYEPGSSARRGLASEFPSPPLAAGLSHMSKEIIPEFFVPRR